MKLTKRVCARIRLLLVFFDHVAMTHFNTHKCAMDSRDSTLTRTRALIIGGRFMSHLAKPAFPIAFGENSAINVKVVLLPTAMLSKDLLVEKICGRLMLYDLACKNIQQHQCSNKQLMIYP